MKRRRVIKGAAASFVLLAASGPVINALQQPHNVARPLLARAEPNQWWFYPLSPRQARVSELIAAGLSTKEIAKSLWITENTTAHHVNWIFIKLDLHQRSQIRDWVATHRPPGDLMRTAVQFPYQHRADPPI